MLKPEEKQTGRAVDAVGPPTRARCAACAQDLGISVQGTGFMVESSGFGFFSLGFGAQRLVISVEGTGLRV